MEQATSRALAMNTALQIGGKALSTVLGVFSVAILLRHLGDFGYGEFTTAVTFLSLFAVVVDFGLTLTTVQMISEPGADEQRILNNLLGLRVFSGVVVFVLAPVISLAFPYSDTVQTAIFVGAIAYLFSSTFQMLIGLFQKRLQMWRVVFGEVLNRLIFLAGILIVSWTGAGVIDVIIALAIGNGVQFLSTLVLSKPFVKLRLATQWPVWKSILSRSWPIGLSIVFNLIYLKADIIFLSVMRTQNEVGLYGGAYKVMDVVTAIPVMFMGLVLPILVASWAGKNREQFKTTMQHTFDFFMVSALPIAVGAYALAEPIMVLIGGPGFQDSGTVLKILAPASAVVFLGALYGHAIVALNKQKPMVLGYAAVAVLTVIGYLVFIPTMGMVGAAWMTLFSEVLITIITFVVVWRVSGALPNLTTFMKTAAACTVMFIFLRVVDDIHVLWQILAGAAVYIAMIFAFGGVRTQTVASFFSRKAPTV